MKILQSIDFKVILKWRLSLSIIKMAACIPVSLWLKFPLPIQLTVVLKVVKSGSSKSLLRVKMPKITIIKKLPRTLTFIC